MVSRILDTNRWNVTLEWQLLEEEYVSCYVINVDPELPTASECYTQNALFELQLGVMYTFNITAFNCDGVQQGPVNENFPVHIQRKYTHTITISLCVSQVDLLFVVLSLQLSTSSRISVCL